jgi:hypothetical protein
MKKTETHKKEVKKSEAKRKSEYGKSLPDVNKVKRVKGHRTLGGLRK